MAKQKRTRPARLRLQFDAGEEDRVLFERLKQRGSIRTYSEALRIGLRVFTRLLQLKEEGFTIVGSKGDERREIELIW
jgi:hypothetical protein